LINALEDDSLQAYYALIVELRTTVLEGIQLHGYNVNDLVTKRIEHEIEQEYGRRLLNEQT